MTGLKTVIRKEMKCFFGSDKSTFLVYAIITIIWSFALAFSLSADRHFWLVFFSVIVAANFSSVVFISERVSGTLEVFITSGISRDAVLFGKMIFVIAMTAAVGAVCATLAAVWSATLYLGPDAALSLNAGHAFLYLSVTFFNAAASAYLSVRMPNPRFLHFANLFMAGAIAVLYSFTAAAFNLSLQLSGALASLFFLFAGVVFTFLARREFSGERIIRPIIF